MQPTDRALELVEPIGETLRAARRALAPASASIRRARATAFGSSPPT